MPQIKVLVTDEEKAQLLKRAKSLGYAELAPYAKRVVLDSLQGKQEEPNSASIRAIQALIPVIAAAFGHSNGATKEQIASFEKLLKDEYRQALK